jgi:hypothetical protein
LNNARGWTADPGSWVFADGLAGEDVCGSRALGRTTTDHTGSPDNHGRVTFSSSGATTARSCLTSPELDTSSATTLRLELWHTLDLQASGVFVVQVGDGTTWTTFDFSARQECSWTSDSFDITPSKGPKMKVRFCAGASTTPFAIRLDDVVVATAPCP